MHILSLALVLASLAVGVSPTRLDAQTLFSEGFEGYTPDPTRRGGAMRAIDVQVAFPGWTTPDYWPPYLCSCKDVRDEEARYYNYCDGYRVAPHSGCNHLYLDYGTRKGTAAMATWGGSAYLLRDFDEPLAMAQRYRLSTWVYIAPGRTIRPERADSIARHFGAQFMNKRLLPVPFGDLYPGAQLTLDTVRYEEWYEVSWTFKPLCDLRRLAIGTFRNHAGPPTHGENDGVTFYLDDLRLERLPDDLAGLEQATGVCAFVDSNLVEAPPAATAGTTVYFASNDTTLDADARAALDAYAAAMAPYRPATFAVFGYADRQMGDNQALSEGRVAAVLDYLATEHQLYPFQFLAEGFGDSRSQAVVADRDRRVELRYEPQLRSHIPYRYALQQTWAGNYAAALRALRMWSVTAEDHQVALVDFDPRLEALRRTPGYAAFAKVHHQRYRRFGKPQWAKTLDSLFHEDQRYRTLAPRVENLNAYFPDIDSTEARWRVAFPADEAQWRAHDEAVFAFAKTWVAQHGWPMLSEVGPLGTTAVTYAYLHLGDTTVLREVAPLLEAACRQGEALWRDYALLVDRDLVLRDLPQRYGTQYRQGADGEMEPYPVEDEGEMRRWRAAWGLDE